MNIEGAIKQLQGMQPSQEILTIREAFNYEKAVRLGIEALERFKKIRGKSYTQVSIDDVWKPLPSETE